MKTTQTLLAVIGLVASAQATYNETVWTTVTTDVYTTYCPQATTVSMGTKTYTATASETLTITDCPCTYSHPIKPTGPPAPPPASYPPAPPMSYPPPVWITTTETVKTYTTYCPSATKITEGGKTYTVTTATTLTISECPCTRTNTYPGTVSTSTISMYTTYCPASTTLTLSGTTYPVITPGSVTIPIYTTTVVPVASTPAPPAPPASAATTAAPAPPATTVATIGTVVTPQPSSTTSAPLQVTNAAKKVEQGMGALVAAGLVAMLL